MPKNKIIVILGPTSSGKTALAVRLAHELNGEIVSADSRQVYRGLDIGTGKDLGEYIFQPKDSRGRKKGKKVKIKYHLIDVADPKKYFDLAKFKKLAEKSIADIQTRGKVPIIAGGTGLYLQALVDGYELPIAKPDAKFRRELEKKSAARLMSLLKKLNPAFASKINLSDAANKRRLIRYIEVVRQGLPKLSFKAEKTPVDQTEKKPAHDFIILGLKVPKEILHERIHDRLIRRLENEGLLDEVARLHDQGVSWKRLQNFGLEYKHAALYLQEKMEYEEMEERLYIAIKKFARKQSSWYRRWERQGRKIEWINGYDEAKKIIRANL